MPMFAIRRAFAVQGCPPLPPAPSVLRMARPRGFPPRRDCRQWLRWGIGIGLCLGLLTACDSDRSGALLGTLEWDRVSLSAPASETIVAIHVREGQQVAPGDPLLDLDDRLAQAELAAQQAQIASAAAVLAELRSGARSEQVDAAHEALHEAEVSLTQTAREVRRLERLHALDAVAGRELDDARSAAERAQAQRARAQAQLDELLHGSRDEQIDAAVARLTAAQALGEQLQLQLAKYQLRSPVAGIVDAIPFRLGDQPPAAATLVSLMSAGKPYARVFVPASRRLALQLGDRFEITLEGSGKRHSAYLRSIAREASFTPYYALTGSDASHLVFRAELQLDDEAAVSLAAGMPLRARPLSAPP